MTTTFAKPHAFYDIFERKGGPEPASTHYCPGCGHGILHKLIAEAVDDLGIRDRTILISPVGCAVFAYYYFNVGNVQAAHGRAPAVATGIKRARPHSIVITYQGDGDLAAIGLNNIIQAANRGEHITVFFVNNALYGMTGGQMAPTTLIGQKTTTTPHGRNPDNEGYPIAMCELLSTLKAPVYIERVAVTNPKSIMRARKAVRRAITCQVDGKGFAFVECLAQCPTGWEMTPKESVEWVMESMTPVFPLRLFRDEIDSRPARRLVERRPTVAEVNALVDPDVDLDVDPKPPATPPLPSSPPAASGRGRSEDVTALRRLDAEIRLKVAGFGGQGILYLGEVLATAAMRDGYEVSWLPSYGPEMRGGTAHCHLVISPTPIGSPVVERATHLIAMNQPSLERFVSEVIPGGVILYDSSLIDAPPAATGVIALPVPATATADGLGSTRVANMVMLGALIASTGAAQPETVLAAIKAAGGRRELIALNRKALAAGVELLHHPSPTQPARGERQALRKDHDDRQPHPLSP